MFLFAVPIYYIVRNIYISVGISNIIYIFLYIITISGILKNIHIKKQYIFLTLCLVLTPYSFGMLEYFNMMFYGGSCYSLKTLVPLLFIWIFLLFEKQENSRKEKLRRAIVLCLYFCFLFITSFSTGLYVMLCGIVPLLCCIVLDIWKAGTWTGRYHREHIGLITGSFIMFGAGYLFHQKFYGLASRTTMALTKIEIMPLISGHVSEEYLTYSVLLLRRISKPYL